MVLFRLKSSHCCCIDANVQHGILWALLLLLIWFHTGVDYSVSSTFIIIIIFFFFFFFFLVFFFFFLVFLSYLFKEHKSLFLLFFFFFLLPFTFFFYSVLFIFYLFIFFFSFVSFLLLQSPSSVSPCPLSTFLSSLSLEIVSFSLVTLCYLLLFCHSQMLYPIVAFPLCTHLLTAPL